jgi:hypothetical protein
MFFLSFLTIQFVAREKSTEPASPESRLTQEFAIDPSIKGNCPACDAEIPMNSAECTVCKAVLNAPDGWRVKPKDP